MIETNNPYHLHSCLKLDKIAPVNPIGKLLKSLKSAMGDVGIKDEDVISTLSGTVTPDKKGKKEVYIIAGEDIGIDSESALKWQTSIKDAYEGNKDALKSISRLIKSMITGANSPEPLSGAAYECLNMMGRETLEIIEAVVEKYKGETDGPVEFINEVYINKKSWLKLCDNVENRNEEAIQIMRRKLIQLVDKFDGFVLALNVAVYEYTKRRNK